MDGRWVPPVDVCRVRPKRCDLELEIILQNNDHTKMRANGVRARKKPLYVFRPCVGGNVVILWQQSANHVTDAAAHDVCDVTFFAQMHYNFACGLFHGRQVHETL